MYIKIIYGLFFLHLQGGGEYRLDDAPLLKFENIPWRHTAVGST